MGVAGGRSERRCALGLLVVLLLVAAGCGDDEDDNSSTTSASMSTSSTADPDTTSTDRTVPNGNGDDSIDYMNWGPDDPPIPGQYASLAASSSRSLECDGAEELGPSDEFWRTVVAVCRALTGEVTGLRRPRARASRKPRTSSRLA